MATGPDVHVDDNLDLVADCGCRLVTVFGPTGAEVTMIPCRGDCPMVQASIEAAEAAGKTIVRDPAPNSMLRP